MKLAPICVVAHRRPQHLQNCLRSLAQCAEAQESELHIFVDGARSDEEKHLVEKVIRCATSAIGFGLLTVTTSLVNLGMATSVIHAISTILDDYERVIVVEEDLVVAPGFLTFMNSGLDAYDQAEMVFGISGYLFADLRFRFGDSAFFSRRASCWGWATWARSWKLLDRSRESLLLRANSAGLDEFLNVSGALSLTKKLRQGIEGSDNSWSPMWFTSIALNNGLFLYPPASLVSNIGFDGSGEHQLHTRAYDTQLLEDTDPFRMPTLVCESPDIDRLFLDHYRASYLQRTLDG